MERTTRNFASYITFLKAQRCGKTQTPPDLVVKFQRIDIVAVILCLVLRLHFVYQRQIAG
jgi:hypothetical protein